MRLTAIREEHVLTANARMWIGSNRRHCGKKVPTCQLQQRENANMKSLAFQASRKVQHVETYFLFTLALKMRAPTLKRKRCLVSCALSRMRKDICFPATLLGPGACLRSATTPARSCKLTSFGLRVHQTASWPGRLVATTGHQGESVGGRISAPEQKPC